MDNSTVNWQIDKMEDMLRKAQTCIENAACEISGISGNAAIAELWNRLTSKSEEISEIIRSIYLIRPE